MSGPLDSDFSCRQGVRRSASSSRVPALSVSSPSQRASSLSASAVYIDLLKDGAATGNYEAHLYRGQLSDLLALVERLEMGSPSAVWPIARSWCMVTAWELEFTLVGGPRAFIHDVIADPELECIQVHAETRIDYMADQVNRR